MNQIETGPSTEDAQLEHLRDQVDSYIIAFRWLWTMNLVAAVVGGLSRRYELAGVAGASAVVALFGAGFARVGRKSVLKALSQVRKLRQPASR